MNESLLGIISTVKPLYRATKSRRFQHVNTFTKCLVFPCSKLIRLKHFFQCYCFNTSHSLLNKSLYVTYFIQFLSSKGAVIFKAGYCGERKLPGLQKLHWLRSRSTKSTGPPRRRYENLFYNSYRRPLGAKTA